MSTTACCPSQWMVDGVGGGPGDHAIGTAAAEFSPVAGNAMPPSKLKENARTPQFKITFETVGNQVAVYI